MNKDKLSKLEDIREENFIWIIYLIIIILSYYANSKETKYLLFDDEESKKEYQGLLILIFSILVIVYYHFAKSSYNDYKELDDNVSNDVKKLQLASFIGSLFVLISIIFLYIAICDKNIDVEIAFN